MYIYIDTSGYIHNIQMGSWNRATHGYLIHWIIGLRFPTWERRLARASNRTVHPPAGTTWTQRTAARAAREEDANVSWFYEETHGQQIYGIMIHKICLHKHNRDNEQKPYTYSIYDIIVHVSMYIAQLNYQWMQACCWLQVAILTDFYPFLSKDGAKKLWEMLKNIWTIYGGFLSHGVPPNHPF